MTLPPQNIVVAFGDSTTAPRDGIKVYAELLPSVLAEAGIPATIINAGVPGDSTDMARQRFQSDVLAHRPNLAIIQFGINDSAVDIWQDPPATAARVSLERFRENLTFFVESLRDIGATVILMTPNQLRWTPQLREMYGKPPYDPDDVRGMTPGLSPYAERVRQVAVEQETSFIDIFNLYDRYEEGTERSCSALLLDGIHPNQQGQDLVAAELATLIRELPNLTSSSSPQ